MVHGHVLYTKTLEVPCMRVSTSLWGLGSTNLLARSYKKSNYQWLFSLSLPFPQRRTLPVLASGWMWLLIFWDFVREGKEGCVLIIHCIYTPSFNLFCLEVTILPMFIFVPDKHKSGVLMAKCLLNPDLLFPLEVTERWACATQGRGGDLDGLPRWREW